MRAHKKLALHNFLHFVTQSLNSEHDLIKTKLLNYSPHFFQSLFTMKAVDTEGDTPATIEKNMKYAH
jgi:hypothetical protein